LGFQTEAGVLTVNTAGLATDAAVEHVAGIKLNPWLGGGEVQTAARPRVKNLGGRRKNAVVVIKQPAVIIPPGKPYLPVFRRDTRANPLPARKVERCPCHTPFFSGR